MSGEMIFAIAATALVGFLIYRKTRTQITLVVGLVAVVSWLVVGLGLVTDEVSSRLSFDIPNLQVFIFALAITAIVLVASRLLGDKSYQTMFVLALAIWLAAGMGWLAGEWLGILAITMPSLIILFVGLLALPPFVLPAPPLPWKWPAALALAYTFLWLVGLWTGRLEMNVILFWVYLQGLLLMLRKPLPLQSARGFVSFVILSGYGLLALWIWRVFRGFNLDPFTLLVLTQGLLVLSYYTLPLAGKNKTWAWQLAVVYVMGYLAVMSVGRVEFSATNFLILLTGFAAFVRFALPSQEELDQLAKRAVGQVQEKPQSLFTRIFKLYYRSPLPPTDAEVDQIVKKTLRLMIDSLTAILLFVLYAIIWTSGLSLEELPADENSLITFVTGLAAIFVPVFVEPSKDWQTFKALITYNLGTNYPYKAIRNRLLVDRAGGDPFAEAFAGPGIILSDADHVIVIYASGKFRQVRPPGVTFTDTFEVVKEIVDLRVQLRVTPKVKAKTKDGVDVTVVTPTALRVAQGGEQLELGKPYPYEPEAVRKTIHAQRIDQEKDEKQSWDKLVRQACVQVMQDIVAEYTLDELLGSQVRKEIAGRMKQGVQAYIQQNDLGIELVGGGISNIVPPDEVVDKRVEHWKAHWESQVKYLEAQAEAEERRLIENARAQAQRSLFLQITERLEEWDRLGLDSGERAKIMALGLLEAIEQAETADPDLQLESTHQIQRMLMRQGTFEPGGGE